MGVIVICVHLFIQVQVNVMYNCVIKRERERLWPYISIALIGLQKYEAKESPYPLTKMKICLKKNPWKITRLQKLMINDNQD